jgi:hypothetical protein
MRRALLLLVVLAGLVAACEDKYKDPDPKVMGYDYYPLEVGDWRVYDVMDIRYMSDVGDTTYFQLRERVDTTFYDQTNTLNFKIIRSVRANENTPWVDDSVMVVSMSDTDVILTRNNTKFVKMVFPVKEGKEWSGDAYNTYVNLTHEHDAFGYKEPYTYEKVGNAFELNGETFPNTVTVIQGYPTNSAILQDDRSEVYAEGVGMIYRKFKRIIYTACAEDDCENGEEYKIHGHERHEKLISHGKE